MARKRNTKESVAKKKAVEDISEAPPLIGSEEDGEDEDGTSSDYEDFDAPGSLSAAAGSSEYDEDEYFEDEEEEEEPSGDWYESQAELASGWEALRPHVRAAYPPIGFDSHDDAKGGRRKVKKPPPAPVASVGGQIAEALVRHLCSRDPEWLYRKLEKEARDYAEAIRVRLVSQLGDSPSGFLRSLRGAWNNMTTAGAAVSLVVAHLQHHFLRLLGLDCNTLHQGLFWEVVYQDPLIQIALPQMKLSQKETMKVFDKDIRAARQRWTKAQRTLERFVLHERRLREECDRLRKRWHRLQGGYPDDSAESDSPKVDGGDVACPLCCGTGLSSPLKAPANASADLPPSIEAALSQPPAVPPPPQGFGVLPTDGTGWAESLAAGSNAPGGLLPSRCALCRGRGRMWPPPMTRITPPVVAAAAVAAAGGTATEAASAAAASAPAGDSVAATAAAAAVAAPNWQGACGSTTTGVEGAGDLPSNSTAANSTSASFSGRAPALLARDFASGGGGGEEGGEDYGPGSALGGVTAAAAAAARRAPYLPLPGVTRQRGAKPGARQDSRSVEELLQFIDGIPVEEPANVVNKKEARAEKKARQKERRARERAEQEQKAEAEKVEAAKAIKESEAPRILGGLGALQLARRDDAATLVEEAAAFVNWADSDDDEEEDEEVALFRKKLMG